MATTTTNPYDLEGYAYLEATLTQWGLGSTALFDWIKTQLIDGWSVDKILFDLEARPEFMAAFPEIEARRQRGLSEGLTLLPLSPGDVLSYRTEARNLASAYGVTSLLDNNEDFYDFIVGDVSLLELESRLQAGQTRVNQAPPEVAAYFDTLFGSQADEARLAFFLDPERALPVLEGMVRQAEAGGAALQANFDLSEAESRLVADQVLTWDQVSQGFGELATARGLFDETITERDDLTVGNEGIASAFGTDAEAAERLRRRAMVRSASTQGSQGGGVFEEGALGLGGVNR